MAIAVFGSFRTYVLFSVCLTTAILSHAFYTKRFFYRSVVHLASSKFAILAVGNMALVSILFIWRVIQAIFLGPLRFRERERLHIRGRDAIIESCFAVSVFRQEVNYIFGVLVTAMLLIKSLHWLAKDRIEFLEEQPLSPRRAHVRIVSLMMFLLVLDCALLTKFISWTLAEENSQSMFALFSFEFAILIIELFSDFVRYIFLVIDLSMDGRWEGKGLYSFYFELLSDLCQLTAYILCCIYIYVAHSNFPIHIIRELYVTFQKFQRRFSDFLRYRRVVATMNDLFADATEEQLSEGDRTCIICREEMASAKVLSCGHMFHARCLQSWLKRQLSCPTCRANIDVNVPVRNVQNAPNLAAGANQPNANLPPGVNPQPQAQQARTFPPIQHNAGAVGAAGAPANAAAAPGVVGAGAAAGPEDGAGANAGAPGDAGARLANVANHWWQTLMNDGGAPPYAGGAPQRAAAGGNPNAFPHARPIQQGVHGNAGVPPPARGPNALAHQQFRARRRVAWAHPGMAGQQQIRGGFPMPPLPNVDARHVANAYLPQPGVGGGAPVTPVGRNELVGEAAEQRNVETDDAVVGSAAEAMTPATSSGTGTNPRLNVDMSINRANTTTVPFTATTSTRTVVGVCTRTDYNALPLERLLYIQEQIEVLRTEVATLVLLATNVPADSSDSDARGRDGGVEGSSSGTGQNDGQGRASSGEGTIEQDDLSRSNENAARGDAVVEEEEEEDEAARIRRHRIEFLSRTTGASGS